MDLSTKILSDITVHMKYAKYLPNLQRRETWYELVTRNKEMHTKKFPDLTDEIENAYKLVYDKKVLPSMRSLQFGGKPIEISPNRLFNCCYLPIDDYRAFSETMFLLLGGTGVGFSVQKHHVEQLPDIRKPNPLRRKRFLIGDSIEGWADCIKILMRSYFEGLSTPDFDFSDIRQKGALLVTSGGRAPGPQPLKDCVHNIKKILDAKGDGSKLRPIEVHDIICFIADAVLTGGIRRAALISLFSMDDEEMLSCKSGSWWELNPQRGRANNSAMILRHKITEESFFQLWKRIEDSGSGEPGVYFSNDKDLGTNPCCEISLRAFQFCVDGNTKLITKDGINTIKNLVGHEVEIWNGVKWSKVKPYQTGDNDRLHRVNFSDGSFLDATDNHKFLIKNRFEKNFKEVETLELINLLKTSKYNLQVPRVNMISSTGLQIDEAYDYGFVLGDGCVHGGYVEAGLFEKANKLTFDSARKIGDYNNWKGTEFTQVRFDLDYLFCEKLKYDDELPNEIFSWNRNSVLNFIAGWADADGSQASKGIRIYGREDKIRAGQLLLTKIGIASSVNKMSSKGNITNLGIRKNDVWYLQITVTSEIPCKRLTCDNDELSNKCKYQNIRSIETLEGYHDSYCLTENELHQCVFNNVLTKQCNLVEANVSNIASQEDLEERVKAATFIGTLQASYTNFHYLRDVWKRITEKEALIGVGMTGIGSGEILKYDLTLAAKLVLKENARVAKLIGINKAARCTTVKPSGTSSLVLGTASGIHAWHNDYYVRRIRVGKNESIYTYLSIYHPELLEDEYFKPKDQAVISLPVKAPEGSILRFESPMDILERVRKFNTEWVKFGHRDGENTHNVSVTVSIKKEAEKIVKLSEEGIGMRDSTGNPIMEDRRDDKGNNIYTINEWPQVGKWMWENRESFNGISVLPYNGGTYIQAPFTDCSKKVYDEMMGYLHDIDLTRVIEIADVTNLSGEIACGSGGCEVTTV